MRFFDLIALSLSALWQQKARTTITTLGVAFAGLVLFISLSVGLGVQETIGREARKHDELRKVGVSPQYEAHVEDTPAGELEFKGDMSPEKRERLRQTIVRRGGTPVIQKEKTPITLNTLRDIAALEHVETVRPVVTFSGWATFDGKVEGAFARGVTQDDNTCRRRLLEGDIPPANSRSVVISEFLAYRWGFINDADLSDVLGKKIQVEFRSISRPPSNLSVYLRSDRPGRDTALLKEKLDKVLPEALAKVDLSPEERRLLETIMRPPTAKAVPHKEVVLLEEFTVIGVFRMPTEKESRQFWRGGYDSGDDLWLPMQTAKELYAQMPYGEAVTFRYVIVVVDDEANVKDVLSRIETMGYRCDALLEFIEREQFLYKLIFAGMTCVAGVALLVAGLGITNTMLMSVLERTREVGIMKAVGAAEEHVQFIFLLEGALIGLAGGILGVLLSWAFSIPGDQWIRSMVTAELKVELEESLFQFPLWLIVGVIAFCSLVTTLAAFYPARRAARVNPVAALRHE